MNRKQQNWRSRFVTPVGQSGGRAVRRRWRLPRVHVRWTPLLIIVIIAALGYIAFGSRVFRITTIDIQGSLNPAVESAILALKGKNSLLLSTQSLEQSLPKQQSSLRSIQIIKGLPDTLRITVAVRQPQFIWKSSDKQYYVDSDGVPFTFEGTSTTIDDHALLVVVDTRNAPVTVGVQVVPRRFADAMTVLTKSFQITTSLKITGVSVPETTREIDVSTDANIQAKFDTTRDIQPQLTAFVLVLAKDRSKIHQYVDLRVSGRAFFQ